MITEKASRSGSFLSLVPKAEAKAAVASFVLSVILVVVKFGAYFATGSSAIFSDALENVVNIFASAFAIYALTVAHTPADEDHPYGHGKIEFVASAFEGGMIVLAGLVIFYKAVSGLLSQDVGVEKLGWGLLLTAVAMAANGVAGVVLIRLGRRQSSATLEADGHHLMSDAATSAAALVALLIVHLTHFTYADPIAAILMACYMGYLGVGLVRGAGAGLMDRQDSKDDERIRNILESHVGLDAKIPRICSFHKLRHRHSGRYHWVDFHLVMPVAVGLDGAHNIASAIEHEIERDLGEGNATAHVEPCTDTECGNCALPTVYIPPPPPHLRIET